jgi:hypothetical protein
MATPAKCIVVRVIFFLRRWKRVHYVLAMVSLEKLMKKTASLRVQIEKICFDPVYCVSFSYHVVGLGKKNIFN